MLDVRAVQLIFELLAFAQPAQVNESPAYAYADDTLRLLVHAMKEEPIVVEWRASGAKKKKSVDLKIGENSIEIPVGAEAAHRVEYALGGRTMRISATRGEWYALPKELDIVQDRRAIETLRARSAPSDVFLAHGFRATLKRGDRTSHLELGRTLGYEDGTGVALDPKTGLVLVASGNVGAVVLTLTERLGKTKFEYWDYVLNLKSEPTRYVLPLAAFASRSGAKGTPRSMLSFSLRHQQISASNATIDVDHLALAEKPIRIGKVLRNGAIVTVKLWDASPQQSPSLHAMDASGAELDAVNDRAERVWACIEEAPGARSCDPPDAPITAIAVPARPGAPIVADTFAGIALVNSWRIRTSVFTSTAGLDPMRFAVREPNAIRLEQPLRTEAEYVGYLSPVPDRALAGMKSIEVTLKGRAPLSALHVGLRDRTGREPKVTVANYLPWLGDDDLKVRIPLAAYRTLVGSFPAKDRAKPFGAVESVTITLDAAAGEERSWIFISRIAFSPEDAPLVVAGFDVSAAQTSLGGKVTFVSKGGATIASKVLTGGGLAVDVGAIGGRAYAIAAFGLIAVDARPYALLSFSVRGGQNAMVFLSDGKNRSGVELAKYAESDKKYDGSADWLPAKIKLEDFGKKLNRSALKEIVFAWEDRTIASETIQLANLRFE